MEVIIPLILNGLMQVARLTSETSILGQVIRTTSDVLPLAAKEYRDVLPIIQNIAATARTNGAVTDEQLAALDELDDKVDAEFEKEAERAQAEDEAAAKDESSH